MAAEKALNDAWYERKCAANLDVFSGDTFTEIAQREGRIKLMVFLTGEMITVGDTKQYFALCEEFGNFQKFIRSKFEERIHGEIALVPWYRRLSLWLWKGSDYDYGIANYLYPVFELPQGGFHVRASAPLLLRYTTFTLKKIGNRRIGSIRTISSLHGAKVQLYIPLPIHREDFLRGEPEPDLEHPFVPSAEDIATEDIYSERIGPKGEIVAELVHVPFVPGIVTVLYPDMTFDEFHPNGDRYTFYAYGVAKTSYTKMETDHYADQQIYSEFCRTNVEPYLHFIIANNPFTTGVRERFDEELRTKKSPDFLKYATKVLFKAEELKMIPDDDVRWRIWEIQRKLGNILPSSIGRWRGPWGYGGLFPQKMMEPYEDDP